MFPSTDTLPPKYAPYAVYGLGIITKYFFSDWDFLAFLLVFVALDTVTDILVAIRMRAFSPKQITAFFYKVLAYGVMLIVAHGLTHFKINGVVNWLFKLVDAVIYTILMGREAISILDNVTKLDPELLPEPIKRRLVQAIISVPERVLNSFIGRALPLDPNDPAPAPPEPAPLPEPAPVEAAEQPPTAP